MKHIQLGKQNGFSILAVILVIVAVIVAIGVWALSGQTNTSNSSSSSADIQAASILNDSASIKSSFDTLIINGVNASNIIFKPNVSDTKNILDPITGIQVPKPNSNAIKANPTAIEGFWVYNANMFYDDTPTNPNSPDQTIFLAGVKDSVCQRINNTLYGSTTIPVFPNGSNTSGATAADPNTTTLTTLGLINTAKSWKNGCLNTGGAGSVDNNLYFRVLKSN